MEPSAPTTAPSGGRPTGKGRLVARRKTSITADDDEFEILARSHAPAPPSTPCPATTLLSPKLAVSYSMMGVGTDGLPSPRLLPALRAMRESSACGDGSPRTPGSTRSTLGPNHPGGFHAATPPASATGTGTPRRPAGVSGVGSPAGGGRPVLGAGGTPRTGVSSTSVFFPTPRGCMGGEEEKKDDDGPSLSKRTRMEVGAGLYLQWQLLRGCTRHAGHCLP